MATDNKIINIKEHNEAFKYFYLHYQENIVEFGDEKIDLLHVDEHHDLSAAVIKSPFVYKEKLTEKEINIITYEQLRISDYIVPLLFFKVINNVIWISNSEEDYNFFSVEVSETYKEHSLLSIKQSDLFNKNHFDLRKINIYTNCSYLENLKDYYLSIDLDYFYSDDECGESVRINITEKEYETYISDKYNKIRLLFGSRIQAKKEGGNYFFEYQMMDGNITPEKKYNKESIILKSELLFKRFRKLKNPPKLVLVCDSCNSGYLNEKKLKFIKSDLYKRLKRWMNSYD